MIIYMSSMTVRHCRSRENSIEDPSLQRQGHPGATSFLEESDRLVVNKLRRKRLELPRHQCRLGHLSKNEN